MVGKGADTLAALPNVRGEAVKWEENALERVKLASEMHMQQVKSRDWSRKDTWARGKGLRILSKGAWTKNVTCHFSKQRMLWPSSPQPLQLPPTRGKFRVEKTGYRP